jgi:helicase required for RNAi-mediated heterochromatin assembly 1
MIEEAAETMEAPVTAGCVSSLEHLILVGDHKQLRPQCGVKMLEKEPFELNVSMFERLVNNGLPYKMLKRQRRMIPEIRRLLGPIYHNDINDHLSMKNPEVRPPVPGMGGLNSFFYTHSWPDSTDEQMSSTNLQEADMIVGFYDHLISNGLTEAQITVLTFYNGQRKLILRKLRNHPRLKRMANDPARIFKVLTVDSYQGEENDVVLLSLVRSNDMGKIGFLSVENRICVALSRAKRGFYMFGNAELLACESKLWAKVINIMLADSSVVDVDRLPGSEPHGRVVFRVPLRCTKHNERMYIETQEDWDRISGGCEKLCGENLGCGHPCHLTCHPFSHDKVICFEPCTKIMPCGHQCSRECYDQCRCKKCGTPFPQAPVVIVTRDENVSDDAASGSEQGSQGTNARAWQAFAKGGVKPHDAILREVQRENYLEQQMRSTLGDKTADKVKPPPKEIDVAPITSTFQALTVVANGATSANAATATNPTPTTVIKATNPAPHFASAQMFDPPAEFHVPPETTSHASPARVRPDYQLVDAPTPTSAAIATPPEPQPVPVAKPRVKVSHRDRFKKKEPSGSPIVTTPPRVAPRATTSAPPVGYTGAPSLTMPTLVPQRVVQMPVAPVDGYDGAMETVVLKSDQNGVSKAGFEKGDLLIDLN